MVASRMPRPDALAGIRARAFSLAVGEGRTGVEALDVCLYKFTCPTTMVKTAAFGVTLGLVLQGRKTLRVRGREIDADPSHFVVFTRDMEYETLASDASDDAPFLAMSLLFRPEQVAKALLALAEAGGPQTPEVTHVLTMPLDTRILDAIERLLRTYEDPLDTKLIAPLVQDEILFRLLRSDAAAAVRAGVGPAQDATRILEAMQFIRANHTRKLSVESLARNAAMSPSHFAHRFTAVARMSPMRYVREVRLDRGRDLMSEHGARAGEVAARVGFESAAHFAREFKRRFGRSPSQYTPHTTG